MCISSGDSAFDSLFSCNFHVLVSYAPSPSCIFHWPILSFILKLWMITLSKFKRSSRRPLNCVAFNPANPNMIATGSWDTAIRLWDIFNKSRKAVSCLSSTCVIVAFGVSSLHCGYLHFRCCEGIPPPSVMLPSIPVVLIWPLPLSTENSSCGQLSMALRWSPHSLSILCGVSQNSRSNEIIISIFYVARLECWVVTICPSTSFVTLLVVSSWSLSLMTANSRSVQVQPKWFQPQMLLNLRLLGTILSSLNAAHYAIDCLV